MENKDTIKDLGNRLEELRDELEAKDGTVYNQDASLDAWLYYSKVYNGKIQMSALSSEKEHKRLPNGYWKDNRRIKGSFVFYKEGNNILVTNHALNKMPRKDGEISLSGDCSFNFNEDKIEKFEEIIDKDENFGEKEGLEELVKKFGDMHHSPLNFSLMPTNGSMNNIKGDGIRGLDRLDQFLASLKAYYRFSPEEPVIIKAIAYFEDSQDFLVKFLETIGSFEKYCELFYHFDLSSESDKELLKDLSENGQKPIKGCSDLIKYMELAVRYWEMQLKHYIKMAPSSETT